MQGDFGQTRIKIEKFVIYLSSKLIGKTIEYLSAPTTSSGTPKWEKCVRVSSSADPLRIMHGNWVTLHVLHSPSHIGSGNSPFFKIWKKMSWVVSWPRASIGLQAINLEVYGRGIIWVYFETPFLRSFFTFWHHSKSKLWIF